MESAQTTMVNNGDISVEHSNDQENFGENNRKIKIHKSMTPTPLYDFSLCPSL